MQSSIISCSLRQPLSLGAAGKTLLPYCVPTFKSFELLLNQVKYFLRDRILTLFTIASGPAQPGVSYKELYKIKFTVLSSQLEWQFSGTIKNSIFKQWCKRSALLSQDLAMSLTQAPCTFLEKNEASDFSNLSAQYLSQQPGQSLMPVVTLSLHAVQSLGTNRTEG